MQRTSEEELDTTLRVGFIGTGNIGNPIARQVQVAGFDLVVCDVRREAARNLLEGGADFGETPAEVAKRSDLVLSSLPGPRELATVIEGEDGLLAGARPGLVHVDLSTISLGAARRAREIEGAAGVHFVDSPVSGGKWAAEKGTLTLMVSGERPAYERATPVLEAIGRNVFFLGEAAGTGTLFKLINNQVFLCAGQALQEGLVLGARAGLELRQLIEVLRASSAGMYCGLAGPTLARSWDASAFDLALAEKDVALALDSARELGVPMPTTTAAHQTYADALEDGLGAKFFIATLAALERRAGIEIPPVDIDSGG